VRLYVTPASPWVRRVRVSILELGIQDRFEFVQTKWSHKWATQAVAHNPEFLEATPVVRIPALVTPDFTLTDSYSICDYLNGELGGYRLLARDGSARWRALADIAVACGIIEAQVARRAELLRSERERGRTISSARCATASSGASAPSRRRWRTSAPASIWPR
jgi:glutathione S-transferase